MFRHRRVRLRRRNRPMLQERRASRRQERNGTETVHSNVRNVVPGPILRKIRWRNGTAKRVETLNSRLLRATRIVRAEIVGTVVAETAVAVVRAAMERVATGKPAMERAAMERAAMAAGVAIAAATVVRTVRKVNRRSRAIPRRRAVRILNIDDPVLSFGSWPGGLLNPKGCGEAAAERAVSDAGRMKWKEPPGCGVTLQVGWSETVCRPLCEGADRGV